MRNRLSHGINGGPRHRRSDTGQPQVVYPDFRPMPVQAVARGMAPAITTQAGCARHIGRVGALAVVMGVGVALATGTGAGLACADTDSGSTESSSSDGVGAQPANDPTSSDTPTKAAETAASGSNDADSTPASRHADAVPTMNFDSSGGAHTSGVVEGGVEVAGSSGAADEASSTSDTPRTEVVAVRVESTRSVAAPKHDSESPGHEHVSAATPKSTSAPSVAVELRARIEEPAAGTSGTGSATAAPPTAVASGSILEAGAEAEADPVDVRSLAREPELPEQSTPTTVAALAALLSPFVLPGPAAPAQSPLLWAMLAMVRRESLSGSANRETQAAAESTSAPTAYDDSVLTTAGTPVRVAVLNNDAAADPTSVLTAVTVVAAPSNGMAVVNRDRSITYTPVFGFTGTDDFVYRVTDSNANAATATVHVTVLPIAVDDAFTTPRDTELVVYDFEGVLANDSVSNGRLIVTSVGTPAYGTVAVTPDGAVTYRPGTRFVGVDSFSYTVTYPAGGTATATVLVNVTAVPNQAPVATNDGYDTVENAPVTGNLLTNDSDPDGDPLTVRIVEAGEGTLALDADGAFTYTPPPNNLPYDTGYSFTYEISDGRLTSQATVTFSVTHVNVPPVLADDYVTVIAGENLVIYPLRNDTDPDGDELYMFFVGNPVHGQADQGTTQAINYLAPDDFTGTDSFTYSVFDSANVIRTATIYVTVLPANRPPVARDYTVTTQPGVPVRITVLTDGLDPDEGDALTVSLDQEPDRGSVVLNADGTFTYTPPADIRRAQDFFSYEITDRSGRSAIGSVEVLIRPRNAAPLAGGNDYTVRSNTTLHVSVDRGVLADDGDPDGDVLNAVMFDGPSHGTIDFLADGSFTYRPNADFVGRDTFRYQAADYEFGSDVATVNIVVTTTGGPEGTPGGGVLNMGGGTGGSGIGQCQTSWLPGSYAVPFAPVFCDADAAWKARNLRRSL